MLLRAGADPVKRQSDGRYALDWAAQEGYEAVVERLLAHDPHLPVRQDSPCAPR
jgi:ankyrin repeat protein